MNAIKKFIGFSLGPILGAIFSAISVPICTHYLLPNEYGKTSMFNLLYTILLMVAYLGFDQAFIREYHEFKNKKKVLLNSMIIPCFITITIVLLVIPFASNISYLLFESNKHTDVVYMLLIALPFLLVERFILVNLRMEERAIEYSFFSLLVKIVAFACTLFFLFNVRQDFLSIVYSTIISHYIGDGVLIFLYHRMLIFKKEYFDWKLVKRMANYALPLVPATVIGTIFNGEDKIFIKYFSDYSELGYYQVSMTLANMVLILQQAFSTFWTPTIFRWKAENVGNEKYEFVQKLVSLFASTCFMGILLVKNFLPVLLSSKYESTKFILPFLLFYPVMSMMVSTTVSGIDFARKTKYTLYFSIAVTVLNFILNLIFVPILGAAGAAIATGLSHVFYFWIRTLYSRKLWFDFEISYLIKTTILLTFAAIINSLAFINETLVYVIDFIIIVIGLYLYKDIFTQIKVLIIDGIKRRRETFQ